MKQVYFFCQAIVFIFAGSFFGNLHIYAITYFIVNMIDDVYDSKYHDMVELQYVDSPSVNPDAKGFLRRHYLIADTQRQYRKTAQADEEGIKLFNIEFCKKMTLPFFAVSALFNIFFLLKQIAPPLFLKTKGSFFTDEVGQFIGLLSVYLYLFFAFVIARQRYSNFITKGYKSSNFLPGVLCVVNILCIFCLNPLAYADSTNFLYFTFLVIQCVLCICHSVQSYQNNHVHLFMDKKSLFYHGGVR